MSENQPKPGKSGVPTDPTLLARYMAIQAAGNATIVAKALGFSRGEAVRLWYVNREPTAQQARKLAELGNYQVPLAQILPEVFGDLTAKELGYTPK